MDLEKTFEKFHRNNVLLALLAAAVSILHFEVRTWIFERDTHRYVFNTLSILESAQKGTAEELLDADGFYPFLEGPRHSMSGASDTYYRQAAEHASSILSGLKAVPVFFDLSFSLNGCRALLVPRPDGVQKFLGNGETFEGLEHEVIPTVICELTTNNLPASIVFDLKGAAKLIGFRDGVAWNISPTHKFFGCNYATLEGVLSTCREVKTVPYRSWGPAINPASIPDVPPSLPSSIEFELKESSTNEVRVYLPLESLMTRIQLLGTKFEGVEDLADLTRSSEDALGDRSPKEEADFFGYKTARKYVPTVGALLMLYYCANLWLISAALRAIGQKPPEVPNFYYGNGKLGMVFTTFFAVMPSLSVIAIAVIALDTFRLKLGDFIYFNPLEGRLGFGRAAIVDEPIWSQFPRFLPEATFLILVVCALMVAHASFRVLRKAFQP